MDVSPQIACVRLCVLLLPAVDDLSTKAVLGACLADSHASAHAEVDLSDKADRATPDDENAANPPTIHCLIQ
jgi:hypothetical protein